MFAATHHFVAFVLLLLYTAGQPVNARRDVWKRFEEVAHVSKESRSQTVEELESSLLAYPDLSEAPETSQGSNGELLKLRLPEILTLHNKLLKQSAELTALKATDSPQLHTEAEPTPPPLPEQFTADQILYVSDGTFLTENATLYYDGSSMRMRTDSKVAFSFGNSSAAFEIDSKTFSCASGQEYVSNGVCRKLPGGRFYDMWLFVQYSKYAGKAQKLGKWCDVWNFVSARDNITLFVKDNVPVSLNSSSMSPYLPGAKPVLTKYTQDFYNVQVGKPQVSMDPPDVCSRGAPLCNSSQSLSKIVTYVAHPKGLYNLSNQDVADCLGDVAFTCYDVSSNHTQADDYGLVSLYVLEVDTRWGAYSLCNGYNPAICFGSESFYVGREASFGITEEFGGQCTDNRKVGNWYSLPYAGQCQGSDTVASGKCSWRIIERVKTIDLNCIFKTHGMLEACNRDGTLPFPESQGIFQEAFQSTDEAQGGCPDVGGPYSL
ncbi:hypothetical protein CYMTET_12465 [Cymbomonas tetramitiformis]|uniref:Uncharacterized protein n=1 Tax=Cymbomonas tetramitiformis TaxID=36881 RepID=A0AAE0GKK7_9CHLO|nr:hypothetical protein CYMTET_12465 [Cymbomonas tetramitiformis]